MARTKEKGENRRERKASVWRKGRDVGQAAQRVSLQTGQNSHRTKELRKPHHTHAQDTHMAMFSTDYTIVPNSLASIILPALHWGYCCTCRLLITRWKTSGAAATSTAERRTKKHEAERQRTEKMPRSSQIISGNYRDPPEIQNHRQTAGLHGNRSITITTLHGWRCANLHSC